MVLIIMINILLKYLAEADYIWMSYTSPCYCIYILATNYCNEWIFASFSNTNTFDILNNLANSFPLQQPNM